MTAPHCFAVPVAGGDLFVARWGEGAVPVIAAHGITASHVSWQLVADALGGDVSLVAPDLRGRGASGRLPAPYGMAAHADDLVAVMDHLDIDSAVVVGHSMGGFVSTVLAENHPDRVQRVVLVDGGVALELPPIEDVDELLDAVIGPAMQRLLMTFPSREAYRTFWQQHPAFAADWSPEVDAYVQYDLEGDEPELRSKVSADAVRADAVDTLIDDTSRRAVQTLQCPVHLLWAPRGLLNQEPGLYSDGALSELRTRPNWSDELVPDVNHYTIGLSERGAMAVADAIRRAVA
jgi:pimeloyl-ACP methyl ester carboxylesterase